MKKGFGVAVVLAAIVALGAGPGPNAVAPGKPGDAPYRSAPAEPLIGGITADEYAAEQAMLHTWLMEQLPAGVLQAPVRVALTDAERGDLARRQEAKEGPAVIGRTKPLTEVVHFSALDSARLSAIPVPAGRGLLQATSDGGFVWALAIRAEGAGAIRVHVSALELPGDADLFFFNQAGQAFGPYSRKGPNGDGDFWTNTVFGDEGVILLRHYGPNGAADLRDVRFILSDVGHIGPKFADSLTAAEKSFCSFNEPCIENASCHNGTPADPAKSAVALMQWISGAFIYTCTGGLLNDTVSTSQIPYFLTANHCLSTAGPASNLETYFQFSISCGSTSCPGQTNPGGIQRLGSTIKATGSAGDFTLLQLNQTPPAGSVFLGWNNTPVANTNNAPLYRISHPAWAPQAYSDQHVDTSAPTCTSWPRGERIYSRDGTGGTEGGSSGSPVVNGASQVVGQLSGACGFNTGDPCDSVNNATVDGAFAYYFASVKPYLDPSACVPSPPEVCTGGLDEDCDGFIDCADADCSASCPTCRPVGTSCTTNSQCCSNNCKGPRNRKTCR